MAKKPTKEPKPYQMKRFGILNPYGDIWSPETFSTEAEAKRHVENFWRGTKRTNLSAFKIIKVNVTVAAE